MLWIMSVGGVAALKTAPELIEAVSNCSEIPNNSIS